mmetsp:Transcript_33505/g.76102  ORF Transcript_33505/g.76102 Transcript_33505/m.76102 type:complete len:204 (+) Transcript_33505:261-872(+)
MNSLPPRLQFGLSSERNTSPAFVALESKGRPVHWAWDVSENQIAGFSTKLLLASAQSGLALRATSPPTASSTEHTARPARPSRAPHPAEQSSPSYRKPASKQDCWHTVPATQSSLYLQYVNIRLAFSAHVIPFFCHHSVGTSVHCEGASRPFSENSGSISDRRAPSTRMRPPATLIRFPTSATESAYLCQRDPLEQADRSLKT